MDAGPSGPATAEELDMPSHTTNQPDDYCGCGHSRNAHEHYRAGSDCSLCTDRSCSSFHPAPAPAMQPAPVAPAPVIPTPVD